MRKIHLLSATILFPLALLAQPGKRSLPEDTTRIKDMEEVVVTGQYRPQSVRNSVYQIKVINRERIEKQGATRLQDVLRNELNLRFSQDLATGGSAITMLGLSGQNVKILVDGLPVTGRQGVNNEFDISQIDINSIDRIEMVEGPMSVVYGADALAGVINIITKKAAKAKIAVNARLHEETVGNEYGISQGIHNQQAGLVWKGKKWDAGGSFAHNYFGGWKDTAIERELVWHKKDQFIANGFIGYNNGKLSLRYRIDGLDEIITNPGNFTQFDSRSGDTLANDQEYLSQRLMHQLQSSYFVNSRLSFQGQASYTDYSRQVFSTTVNKRTGAVNLDPAAGRQSVVDFTGLTFRGTALYKLSDIFSFQPGVDINIDKGEGERLKTGLNEVNDYAFFISSEITPSDKISIRPGLRFIKNSVYDAPPVIPSINTKFVLTKNLDFRFAYARGFRAPSLRELYFDFVDANHNIFGNPNLKAETSNSFTASLAFKKAKQNGLLYSLQLAGYYNDVKNLIDYSFSSTSATDATLYNLYRSKTTGFNLNTSITYKKWNITAGAGYTGFNNDQYEADNSLPQIVWSAEVNATAGYSFTSIGLDINLYYKFTGKRPSYVSTDTAIVLAKTDGFHIADLTASKKICRLLSVNTGVRNLFNVDRINSSFVNGGIHSGGGLNIASGRSYFASLLFNWSKK